MTREKGLHPVAGVCCSICVAQPRVNPEGARCRDARLSVFQRVSQRNEVCDNRLERRNVGPGSRKAANLEWRIVAWKTVRIRHREAEHKVHSYVVDYEPAIRSTSDGLHAEANLRRAPELPDQARRDARGAGVYAHTADVPNISRPDVCRQANPMRCTLDQPGRPGRNREELVKYVLGPDRAIAGCQVAHGEDRKSVV